MVLLRFDLIVSYLRVCLSNYNLSNINQDQKGVADYENVILCNCIS